MKPNLIRNALQSSLHPKIEKTLTDQGFPTHSKYYRYAHTRASVAEKKEFSKGYEEMKSVDRGLLKHELAGKNFRNGKIEVSAKVPQKFRREVAFHERYENTLLRERDHLIPSPAATPKKTAKSKKKEVK